jgi:hypothetical protein
MNNTLIICEANSGFEIEEWKAYSSFGQSYFVTALPWSNDS